MNYLTLIQILVAKWKAKSPRNMRIVTWLTFVTTAILAIPQFLSDLGLTEAFWPDNIGRYVSILTLVASVCAKLTTEPEKQGG